jgi:hypothetical protein
MEVTSRSGYQQLNNTYQRPQWLEIKPILQDENEDRTASKGKQQGVVLHNLLLVRMTILYVYCHRVEAKNKVGPRTCN